METTYRFTYKQLNQALAATIDMYREYIDVHGYDEESARGFAISETIQGIDADRELVANDPTERLRLQLPDKEGQMRAHLEAIRDYVADPSAPTVNAADMNFYQRMEGIYAQATAALA